MSLNSVVNNLVRAAAGIPPTISDADLDAHVAKLLADEAEAKEIKWSELGLTGLLGTGLNRDASSPHPSLPKTNKRFLASVIRTVDGHNTALLRQQAESARETRADKLGESSRSGQRRGGAASRLFGGALRGMGKEREGRGAGRHIPGRNPSPSSRRDFERSHGADRSRRHGEERRTDRSRRYDEQDRQRDGRWDSIDRRDTDDREDRYGRDGRYRSDEGRNGGEPRHEPRSDRSPDSRRRARHDDVSSVRDESRRHRRERSASSELHNGQADQRPRRSVDGSIRDADRRSRPHAATSRSVSPSPLPDSPPAPALSKMDKYFTQSYDPRLDLPAVPAQGIVHEVGWDNMLAVLKERGKKRRHQSPSLSDADLAPPPGVLPNKRSDSPETAARKLERSERKARKEERRRRKHSYDSSSEGERDRRREKRKEKKRKEAEAELKVEGGTKGSGLLDGYEYVKKGGTRAWDVGK
ncbi:hypothetical protein IAU60_004686 [Kwoniella sp. DSM 27419]